MGRRIVLIALASAALLLGVLWWLDQPPPVRVWVQKPPTSWMQQPVDDLAEFAPYDAPDGAQLGGGWDSNWSCGLSLLDENGMPDQVLLSQRSAFDALRRLVGISTMTPFIQFSPTGHTESRDGVTWHEYPRDADPALGDNELESADLVGSWRHFVEDKHLGEIELQTGNTVEAYFGPATWSLDGRTVELRWPHDDAPGGEWIDRCVLTPDGMTYSGENQLGARIHGRRVE